MKKERFLSFIEDRRSSREFGGREISEGERGFDQHGDSSAMSIAVESEGNIVRECKFGIQDVRRESSFSDMMSGE